MNNRNLFSHSFGGQKARIKVAAGLKPSLFPWLAEGHLLCPDMVIVLCMCIPRVPLCLCVQISSYKDTIQFRLGPAHVISLYHKEIYWDTVKPIIALFVFWRNKGFSTLIKKTKSGLGLIISLHQRRSSYICSSRIKEEGRDPTHARHCGYIYIHVTHVFKNLIFTTLRIRYDYQSHFIDLKSEIRKHKMLPKGLQYSQNHFSDPDLSDSIKAHVLTTTLDCTGPAEHPALSLLHKINVSYPHHHHHYHHHHHGNYIMIYPNS